MYLISAIMKIFIAILLLFPLLAQAQAKANPYRNECKAEYLKKIFDISAIEDICNKAAKYEEEKEVYGSASWFYLLGGSYKYNIEHIEKFINKKSTVIYSNIGHSYALESNFDKTRKMYLDYLNTATSVNNYMQKDYKLLFKLYPQYKNQLDKGLAIWDELYYPLIEINELLVEYQFVLNDKDNKNYKKTDKEKIDYLFSLINQQENKHYSVKKHTKRNTRLLMYLYLDVSKIYKRKKEYIKQVDYYSKAVINMEIAHRNSSLRHIELYDKIVSLYKKIQDYKNALKYAVKSLEVKEKIFGFEHIDTIDSYIEVSSLCRQSGKYKESIKYYKKIMQYMENDLRTQQTDRAEVYRHIAELYSSAEDSTNAIKYYKKSLDASGVNYGWLY